MPTLPKVKRKLFKMLPEISSGEIAELGSGWGTLAFILAKKYPSLKVIGYEISPVPFFYSNLIAKIYSYPNLTLIRQDFFHSSFKDKKLVVCYLYPAAMEKLKAKFEKELSPEAYVISHTFAIPGWKPLVIEHASDLYHTPIYLYQM
jgi:16S rRNA A1518/A1519 N6-dimethyltransferase RsmA/KsgA/DIM1 with predicted DNA glycosylase/AP lyase activity